MDIYLQTTYGTTQRESINVFVTISGTTRGGADVQRAIETGQSRFRINGVDHAKEHHVTLTAFNKAGLYTTGTFVVAYSHTSDAG